MKPETLINVVISAFFVLFASTGFASAEILDPVIALVEDIRDDTILLITVAAVIAVVVGVVGMMFGMAHAGKVAMVAIAIVIAVNAQTIVDSIGGLAA
jgi:hypothetical protein